MGYFSNGTEGELYEAQFCARCAHRGADDGPGCPVMLAHVLHAYSERDKASAAEEILTLLIPRCKDAPGNDRCAMFIPQSRLKPVAQRRAHRTPSGGKCWNTTSRQPIRNDAGQVIGERCGGCGAAFSARAA